MLVPKTARKAVRDARKQGGSMADTGKSNGHLGIHHPFGARHGTPVAGQRPPLAAAHEPLAEQMYPKDWRAAPATLPVATDAPLEDRLYPDSIHDVVARHSRGDHSTLRPYTPEPDAKVPFYRMGVRPLNAPFLEGFYSKRGPIPGQHIDHMHFVGSDGSNFGLTDSERPLVEKPEQLKRYQVESPKYRQEYIDRARDELEAEWQTKKAEAHQSSFGTALRRYSLPSYNCQHYFAEIIKRAQSYETREKPLVLP